MPSYSAPGGIKKGSRKDIKHTVKKLDLLKSILCAFASLREIGNQSQFPDRGLAWDGILDEARVYNVPKNEHWIKLDYESQREGQHFLT